LFPTAQPGAETQRPLVATASGSVRPC